jgi:hypothetical protein
MSNLLNLSIWQKFRESIGWRKLSNNVSKINNLIDDGDVPEGYDAMAGLARGNHHEPTKLKQR